MTKRITPVQFKKLEAITEFFNDEKGLPAGMRFHLRENTEDDVTIWRNCGVFDAVLRVEEGRITGFGRLVDPPEYMTPQHLEEYGNRIILIARLTRRLMS